MNEWIKLIGWRDTCIMYQKSCKRTKATWFSWIQTDVVLFHRITTANNIANSERKNEKKNTHTKSMLTKRRTRPGNNRIQQVRRFVTSGAFGVCSAQHTHELLLVFLVGKLFTFGKSLGHQSAIRIYVYLKWNRQQQLNAHSGLN